MKSKQSDDVLSFMREETYKPMTAEDLAQKMDIRGSDLITFWQTLTNLENTVAIIKTQRGKYALPEHMDNIMVGELEVTAKGYGFVLSGDSSRGDLFIPPDAMNGAFSGDKVVAKIKQNYNRSKSTTDGEIIRIVERASKNIVGTFDVRSRYGFVTPDDKRLALEVFIPKEEFNKARTGSKVVAEITKWPQKNKNAEGRIIEVLGQEGEPGVDILSIIKNHNLPTEFPPEIERAAKKIPDIVSEDEIAQRRDLRGIDIFTIDGEDAKDLDDAVHVKKLKNGNSLLGVHIADVSYYVREKTPLDREALARGTSVYLVDRVLPMLPKRLSNGICSLNASEERLTITAEMEIDNRGQVVNYEIFPSVIKVKKRLSYTIVRKILAENDEPLRREYRHLIRTLEEMKDLSITLRERRIRRGAIDFNFPELKIITDENGVPTEIIKRTRSIAESIIEEFMLIANETVAKHLSKLEIPSIHRVHEEPDRTKLTTLNTVLNNFGERLPPILKEREIKPMVLQKILEKIAGRPEERIISTIMLRSLKQARYDAENLGHFGLAADYYTHFTSPIRRYPDLIVHRILRETFAGEVSDKRRKKLAAILPEIALQSSERERAAVEAERETEDLKKTEYMQAFIGQEFAGVIVGVTSFGFFVEIENGVEGLVHIASLEDDYYKYIEAKYCLTGERTGKTYRLGDEVKIIVAKVNLDERTIDYVISSNSKPPKTIRGKTASPKLNHKNKKTVSKKEQSKKTAKTKR